MIGFRSPFRPHLFLALLLLAPGLFVPAAVYADDSLAERRAALKRAIDDQWEYVLSTHPEFASMLGDKRWNDQAFEVSPAHVARDRATSREILTRLKAIDPAGFPEQEALSRELLARDLEETIELERFDDHLMPVTQRAGIQLQAPRLAGLLSFDTTKDYDDYLARLRKLPARLDGTIAFMREGMARGLMPPKYLLEKVATQAEAIATTDPASSPFAAPLGQFPDGVPVEARERIRAELIAAVSERVQPAFKAFARFVADEYAPRGRSEVGIWSLPDGEARYAARVRTATTTDLTPAAIHRLGLAEVARIEGEMLQVTKSLGFTDLASFRAALAADPAHRAKSGDELVALYRRYLDEMAPKLPELFGRLPKAKLIVEPMGAFRAPTAAGADYDPGTPDGSRPGRVNVNTYEATQRKTISIESTAYHEGSPGHHLQISIAQELDELPPFRQQAEYTAYNEGWALYAERLADEIGCYRDPYSRYGRLEDEMLRAIRLVVDTGLHAERWSREQVVDYIHAHSALDEIDVQSETDRYVSWPAQALGYKIGELKIVELRERARKALGARFDLRAFHDQVLGAGALPLSVLERRIDAWIATQRALPAG